MEREHVLNFVKFQNFFAYFGILYGLGWMPTAFREMILETVFVSEWMEAVWTDVGLTFALCPAKYETRKTFD